MVSGGPEEILEEVGHVTHYFSIPQVAALEITRGTLVPGDMIRFMGHTTDVTQVVVSMQMEHQPIERASAGDLVGIQVGERVREHDIVYKVTPHS